MEGGSEVERTKPPEIAEMKSKRKMKTASQLEILEKTYAVEQYPPEPMRAELSVQLGLSDRQLQMWFCHRRLKDRKAQQPKETQAPGGADVVSGPVPGPVAEPSLFSHSLVDPPKAAPRVGTAVARISRDFPPAKRYYEPQLSMLDRRAIAFVEAQLCEPLREDGPVLGMEFDPLPPDAFGVPMGRHHKARRRIFEARYERTEVKPAKGVRPVQEYQFLPEKPTVRSEMCEKPEASYNLFQVDEQVPPENTLHGQIPNLNLAATPPGRHVQQWTPDFGDYAADPRKNTVMDVEVHGVQPFEVDALTSSERRIAHNEEVLRIERKRKNEEARIARELEAHEKRIRKELKRQDILRRKREEQIRKEMERNDRERRKEEERLLREKQREEERYMREQRREVERREKYLLKESMRAEKMRQKEEIRRLKEATRLKAASERAIARRIAKESMELMEDGRLELMEIAASCKGLPSIASLDYETLQNLDLFIDSLAAFPPNTVPLKKPFAIQPWLHSEENVANLLMVWRFLITFTDVLQLWPFTLDEFVQAFHDFDARLLGEIHMSLLNIIIRDIEDAARTPSVALGANQAGNPGGGHPHIVEGAYTWGFDISSWHRHLNPLTWPEILRQLALSAGFGPQLKRKMESSHLNDDVEVNDGENIISILRDGTAAQKAFAKMQERGYASLRRSRHRLTPGTVKFAAFHVLSVEGSDGLNILDVAEKIQKSGLRDLSTSKTPEASISAALSRDTKLFERTAPSTYCVRAAYRKDPADAETVLSAARDKIRAFKIGMEEEEEADDAERDEDSDSDSGEDPEVDDLGAELNLNEDVNEKLGNKLNAKEFLENGIESIEIKQAQAEIALIGLKDGTRISPINPPGKEGDSNDVADTNGEDAEHNLSAQETDIDGSTSGEPWVEGLVDGEYSDLSVEDRLGALVALIGVASEGNTIRLVLEGRLEAATSLKKQMWAEAQLDKRRVREDFVTRPYYPSQTSCHLSSSPVPPAEVGRNGTLVDPSLPQEQMIQRPVEENLQILDNFGGPDVLSMAQAGYAAERSRSQLKSYIGYKAEQLYEYRSLPLGQDRRRNRYWRFAASASRSDPGCGRIFVELRDGQWRLIDSEEGLNALLAALDVRGIREANLVSMLRKIEPLFKEAVRRNLQDVKVKMQTKESLHVTMDLPNRDLSKASTSFLIELSNERTGALKRYQEFENWLWRECLGFSILCAAKFGTKRCMELLRGCPRCHEVVAFVDDNCPSCQKNSGTSANGSHFMNYWIKSEEMPSINPSSDFNLSGSISSSVRIRSLKVQLSAVEASIPSEAVADAWTDFKRKDWGTELSSSSSADGLLQALTLLEMAIKRDYISSKFETTSELLGLSDRYKDLCSVKNVHILPWVPKTTSAVALRLMELDDSISYTQHLKADLKRDEGAREPSKLSIRYSLPSRGIAETSNSNDPFGEDSWVDSGGLLGSTSRWRGSRGRPRAYSTGLRSQRKGIASRSLTHKGSEKPSKVSAPRGRPRGRGRKRGRGARNLPKAPPVKTQREVLPEKAKVALAPTASNAWNNVGNDMLLPEDTENSSSSERFEYGEENEQEMGYEYDVDFRGQPNDLMEGKDYEDEEELGIEGYVDGEESDEDGMRGGGIFGTQNTDPDEEAADVAYSSSDYSDEDDL